MNSVVWLHLLSQHRDTRIRRKGGVQSISPFPGRCTGVGCMTEVFYFDALERSGGTYAYTVGGTGARVAPKN